MARVLQGKVAVVTGSGRGIGRGIALLMAEHGAKVVVNDLGGATNGTGTSATPAAEVVAEIKKRGGVAVANHDSVATMEGGERIIRTAVDHFGRIDILVNNAGILRDRMIFNMSEEEWDAVIAVHLKGHFACTKPASILMRQQRSGRIINFTSVSGLFGNTGQANYGAAKDAIAGLTRVLSRELGRYGITVNCISPGAATRLTATIPDAAYRIRAERGISSAARGPTQGEPEDIAPMVVYLASDAAADINGQIFHVSGGQVSLLGHPTPLRSVEKEGFWTPEELAIIFPSTLGMDLVNPAPPVPPTPPAQAPTPPAR